MSLNKVMLIARVGRDPDVRSLESQNAGAPGRKVASFSAATTERYRDKSGEQKENTDWHNIVVWGKSADFVEGYVKQGALVYIEGKLRSRKYTDKSGAERYVTEVLADSIQLLPRMEKREEEAPRPSLSSQKPSRRQDDDLPEDTDNLPF